MTTVAELKAQIRAQMKADGHDLTGVPFVNWKAFGPNQGRYYRITCLTCGAEGHVWSKDKTTLYSGLHCD